MSANLFVQFLMIFAFGFLLGIAVRRLGE